jgi:hypothetical protein
MPGHRPKIEPPVMSANVVQRKVGGARLTAEQAAWVLNCQLHDVPILVAGRLLKPLGNPSPYNVKFFAASELLEKVQDRMWLSLLAVQEAGGGVQTDGERGCGSEKQGFGVEKRLDKPSDGRKIAETISKTQFDAMNNRSNGKSRINCYDGSEL